VGEEVVRSDIEAIDCALCSSLDALSHMQERDAALFSSMFFESFTTSSSAAEYDARASEVVELLPGGAQMDLTYENRILYCDMLLEVRTQLECF
jgi:hypothetical protein